MKKNILIGILTSLIFTILVQPILGVIWDFLNLVFVKYIDSLYSNAALGKRNWIDFIIFANILNGGIIWIILKTIEITKKNKQLFSNEKKEIDVKKKKKFEKLKSLKKIKILTGILYLLVPISIILVTDLIFKSYSDLQLNTSFNQRLNSVSPYLKEKEKDLFISEWSLMKNKSDFKKINAKMEKIAIENGIVLPENLLK